MKKPTAISLFAGCGGDSLGLEQAGFELVGFVEFWKPAIETHLKNFPGCALIGEAQDGDITKIPDSEFRKYDGKVDLIFAGFPCQGFSHAGKKDPDDPRNKLFWEFVRAAKIIKPKWIIGENVAGLLNRKTEDGQAMVWEVIVDAFREIGYEMAKPEVLDANAFGAPQKRKRVFFVGSRTGEKFVFPEPSHAKNPVFKISGLRQKKALSIRNIVEPSLERAIPFNFQKLLNGRGAQAKEKSGLAAGNGPHGKPHPYLTLKISEGKLSFGRRVSPYHAEVVDIDDPSNTIHCGYSFQPRLFVPMRDEDGEYYVREFTMRELAQLQGFPADFEFCGSREEAIRQIGNAVPVPLAKAIAGQVLKQIHGEERAVLTVSA